MRCGFGAAARSLGEGCSAVPSVTEAEAATLHAEFDQDGELSAEVELRRLFPGVGTAARVNGAANSVITGSNVQGLGGSAAIE